MKILQLSQAYHPVRGGAEWMIQQLCEQMATQYQDEVTVYTAAVTKPIYFWKDEGGPMPVGVETINGVTVRRFPVYRGFQTARQLAAHGFHRFKLPYHDWARSLQVGPIIWGLADEVANSKADVVMAGTFPFLHMHYAVRGAKKANLPVVLLGAIHADDVWGYDRAHFFKDIARADAYLALTEFEKELVVSRGAQANKVFVVGGGVWPEPFEQAQREAARQKYGWGDDPVIVVLTRQSALKGLDALVEAMPLVWQWVPNVRLLLAGAKREYTAVLETWRQNLSAAQSEKVTLINDFPEAEKAQLLKAANFLVHTSANESFGIVFTEAWAAGIPVIGANVGAIASLITDGQDGLLFKPNNAQHLSQKMIEMLENPTKQAEMGKNGLAKVHAKYNWTHIAQRVREIYQQVIEWKREER